MAQARRPPSGACVGSAEVGGPTLIFAVLLVTSCMVNFDSGGTAATLVHLSRGCPDAGRGNSTARRLPPDPNYPCLSESDKGVLGAAPYIGLCFGCPLAGELLRTRSEKRVLLYSLAGNVVATMLFASVLGKHCLWAAKFLVGATQSVISIYAPVWVSKFAPVGSKTMWYGLMQSSAAIGNLFGYAVCGYLVELGVYFQRAFQIQALWLAATCMLLAPVPRRQIDVSVQPSSSELQLDEQGLPASKALGLARAPKLALLLAIYSRDGACPARRQEEPATAHAVTSDSGLSVQLAALSQRPLFLATGGAICGLYFVVTAIQYWASQFFVVEFGRSGAEVTTVFILVAGSAPLLGVVIGSSIIDRLGGYETPQQTAHACFLTASWGAVAALGGVLAACVEPPAPRRAGAPCQFYFVVACVWVQLLFGGAVLPAVTGICMGSVPEGLRKSASSWSMLFYNVFGFSLGAYLPGCVAERFSLRLAMHIVFLSSLASCIAMAWACAIARRAARGAAAAEATLDDGCGALLMQEATVFDRMGYGTELTGPGLRGRAM